MGAELLPGTIPCTMPGAGAEFAPGVGADLGIEPADPDDPLFASPSNTVSLLCFVPASVDPSLEPSSSDSDLSLSSESSFSCKHQQDNSIQSKH